MEQVFNKDMDREMIVLLAARASRLENQDAIDAAIVNMLADPKEVKKQKLICCSFERVYNCTKEKILISPS